MSRWRSRSTRSTTPRKTTDVHARSCSTPKPRAFRRRAATASSNSGCVELFNRKLTGNDLHIYFNPERESHEDALKVHGLTTDFLRDKPQVRDACQRCRRVPARRGADHPQRGLRRRLSQQGTGARRPAAAAQLRRRGDRHARHGQGGLPGQAQLARCPVRPLRRRPLEPDLSRRQARRPIAGRCLHQPHARTGCVADRRGVERADARQRGR